MKRLFAMILIGGVLLAGCGKKQVTADQAVTEAAPATVAQEASIAAVEAPGPAPDQAVIEGSKKKEVRAAHGANKIFFDFNSHLLTPASRKALDDSAFWLQAQPEALLVIEGHADERGSDRYNLALGQKRAAVVRDYLVARGIAPERLTIVSYGREKATRGAVSEIVWARDRKAQLVAAN